LKKPAIVSIVGRQNVGKSTLYNRIAGRKGHSITENTPGVTRDVLEIFVEREELHSPILLRDTPGLDIDSSDDMTKSILEISFRHLAESDIILHVLDIHDIRAYDYKLIELFRKDPKLSGKPVLYLANKADKEKDEEDLDMIFRLGVQEPIPISALGKRNLGLIFEKLNYLLPKRVSESALVPDLRMAIVGKPNSGKSSLLNAILGFDRAVVSEIAGTTRDSLNSVFRYKGKLIELVDTAGIRKKSKKAESLEFYSYKRTLRSIEESDIVVFLLDATKGVGEYDKRIFAYLEKTGKPVIIGFNKWDLIPDKTDKTLNEFKLDAIGRFPALKTKQILTLSALTRQRVTKLMDTVLELSGKLKIKIPTSELNQKIRKWLSDGKLARASKRAPKVKYATQISASPFHLVFFVNSKELFTPSVLSYFRKKMDSEFGLGGIPVKIELRENERNA
jgi:GTP-binding protein